MPTRIKLEWTVDDKIVPLLLYLQDFKPDPKEISYKSKDKKIKVVMPAVIVWQAAKELIALTKQ